ncbi:DEAD-box ATP-dependent RNA helicase 10 [Spinacia oleracea]|uniref:DEAD-box ATP-dependent RNA helicase 10 n=1 Tax=Spinacia oleracea TaxID=3562 RepID=A0ABM3RCP6_SPIOL|nr:DEAD-box ATP-dependent RNA helicase 10-like [Spinacia oleracea]
MEEQHIEEVKSFEELNLCKPLIEACVALGWTAPTKLQADSIPHALEGKDIVVITQAGFGSGTTGAFALPIIEGFLGEKAPQPYFCCVLSPTTELTIQIAETFKALGGSFGLRTAVLDCGVNMASLVDTLGGPPHIVVGTPQCLENHLTYTEGFSLSALKYLVLNRLWKGASNASKYASAIQTILHIAPKK